MRNGIFAYLPLMVYRYRPNHNALRVYTTNRNRCKKNSDTETATDVGSAMIVHGTGIAEVRKTDAYLLWEGSPNMANEQETQSRLPEREKLKSDTAEVVDKAKNAGQQQLESGKQTAAAQAEKVAAVLDQASSQFREEDLPKFAEYASEIGSTIKNFADNLHNRSIDDLINDTRTIARRNPTMFVLGSIAIGVAVSRFLKASALGQRQTYQNEAAKQRTENVGPMSLTDF